MIRTTLVYYKCVCMKDEASFDMRERHINEDIMQFMNRMGERLAQDHRARSPFCASEKTEYVKIKANPEIGRSSK